MTYMLTPGRIGRLSGPAFVLLMAVFGGACGPKPGSEQSAIVVAAASDLRKVSEPLATVFERSSRLRVTFSFASSGQLEQQILRGASFDVYAPATRSYCQSVERDGLADAGERLYALGRLVAWSKTMQLTSLDELKDGRVRRIAIANPQYAPYGLAAQQALQNAALWPAVKSKLVYGETVAQAYEMAQTANAEVAFVAVALIKGEGGFSFPVAQNLYTPIEQAAVVLKGSRNKSGAEAFVNFLLSPEAQRIFQEYGFGPPEPRQ
jgi:molybdate transport system substrate-binding protein